MSGMMSCKLSLPLSLIPGNCAVAFASLRSFWSLLAAPATLYYINKQCLHVLGSHNKLHNNMNTYKIKPSGILLPCFPCLQARDSWLHPLLIQYNSKHKQHLTCNKYKTQYITSGHDSRQLFRCHNRRNFQWSHFFRPNIIDRRQSCCIQCRSVGPWNVNKSTIAYINTTQIKTSCLPLMPLVFFISLPSEVMMLLETSAK